MKAPIPKIITDFGTPLETALYHAADGWRVFPVKGKQPLTSHGVKDATSDPTEIKAQFTSAAGRNATGVAGSCLGIVVVDIDPRNGGYVPEDLPATRVHYSGRGDGGCHLIYKLPAGVSGLKSSTSKVSPGVDIKTGEGSYIALPGSIHPVTWEPYTANDTPIAEVPSDFLNLLQAADLSDEPEVAPRGPSLAELLASPPEVGGRNEWLTRVAGHYARTYRGDPESYVASVNAANDQLRAPLDDDELTRTRKSIWSADLQSRQEPELEEKLTPENGWLVSTGTTMKTLMWEKHARGKMEKVPFDLTDFDLRVKHSIWNDDQESWDYVCDLITPRDPGMREPIIISSLKFGDPKRARQQLSGRGLNVMSGANLVHKDMDWAGRILTYLRSQKAPQFTYVDHCGWHDLERGYVTSQGAVTSQGLRDFEHVRPTKSVAKLGGVFGFAGDQDEAREILAEILTYQEPEITSIFGAWWAASLAKQWISPLVSLFPVCAVEASSESGKTTGFFELMVPLGGQTSKAGQDTLAVLRNVLAASSNLITWVDDLDRPEIIHETLRVLTAEGTLRKMNSELEPVEYQLRGSLFFTGESLGLDSQKALRDRVISLTPPSPRNRMSQKTPGRSQWDDVKAMRARLYALGGADRGAGIAGHFLTLIAGLKDVLPTWVEEEQARQISSSRSQDRDTVLLVGARIVDYLTHGAVLSSHGGDENTAYGWVKADVVSRATMTVEERLEVSDGSEASDLDTTLMAKLLPEYLATMGHLESPAPAAELREDVGELWVSLPRIAMWWRDKMHGRIEPRTESRDSLTRQCQQLRAALPEDVDSSVLRRMGSGRNVKQTRVWIFRGSIYQAMVGRMEYR